MEKDDLFIITARRCKRCGLNSPWAAKNKTAVIEAWNEMIRARRRGEYRNGL